MLYLDGVIIVVCISNLFEGMGVGWRVAGWGVRVGVIAVSNSCEICQMFYVPPLGSSK